MGPRMVCLARRGHNDFRVDHPSSIIAVQAQRVRCAATQQATELLLRRRARRMVQGVARRARILRRLIVGLRARPDPARVDAQSRRLPVVRKIDQLGERRIPPHEITPADDLHGFIGIVVIAAQTTPTAAGARDEQHRVSVAEYVRAYVRGFSAHGLAHGCWFDGAAAQMVSTIAATRPRCARSWKENSHWAVSMGSCPVRTHREQFIPAHRTLPRRPVQSPRLPMAGSREAGSAVPMPAGLAAPIRLTHHDLQGGCPRSRQAGSVWFKT